MQRTPGMEQTQSLAGARVVRRARRSAEWPTGVLMVAPVALLIAVFFIYSTYRAVYTVRFGATVYVLHCFQKKSIRGFATPKPDLNLIRQRLKIAEQLARKE